MTGHPGRTTRPSSRWPPGPPRVGAIRLRLVVPGGAPAERRTALLAVATHRTVRNTLRQEPGIAIDLA
jgi:putative redox protein